MIKIANPNQKLPAYFRSQIKDLHIMNVICTFQIKMEPNLKDDVSKTSDHIQMKITMLQPSQEPPTSSRVPNEYIKDKNIRHPTKP